MFKLSEPPCPSERNVFYYEPENIPVFPGRSDPPGVPLEGIPQGTPPGIPGRITRGDLRGGPRGGLPVESRPGGPSHREGGTGGPRGYPAPRGMPRVVPGGGGKA